MVLYVGRLERTKGAVDLVEAFVRYLQRDSDIGLVLVGDGPARSECERAASALPGRIFVAGAQPLERVASWLGASDLLALPSYNEGTPNVVLEALASGRRVVATRVGGIVDLLRSPALGRLIDPRHPDELALRLREEARAAYDPSAVAEEARVSSWDDSARALHACLELAIGAHREPARSPAPVLVPAGRSA
jgi:glycosyltransferase involved in cell wall biosynthesis